MGIASAFTIVFFASETSITLCLLDKQCHRRLRTIIHSLAYLSSTFVLGLTIINLVLVNIWRTPHNSAQFGRSIQGRCHWGLDVVWSGTGMACARADNKPFGGWLSAAISRSVVSALFIVRAIHSPLSCVFVDLADRLHTTLLNMYTPRSMAPRRL